MVNSRVGRSYPSDWKNKLKRLVANKNQQEVIETIEDVFNKRRGSCPLQLKLFTFDKN